MKKEIASLIDKSYPLVSNLANISAYLNNELKDINWVGFYLLDKDTLYLGPFQGDIACYKIPIGKGVCGEAALNKQTIIVDNVLTYPNHIACSSLSRSEIVIPIIVNDEVKGVLDIDSPLFSRFTKQDQKDLEEVVDSIKTLFE